MHIGTRLALTLCIAAALAACTENVGSDKEPTVVSDDSASARDAPEESKCERGDDSCRAEAEAAGDLKPSYIEQDQLMGP